MAIDAEVGMPDTRLQGPARSFSISAAINWLAICCFRAESRDSEPSVTAWISPMNPTRRMAVAIITSMILKAPFATKRLGRRGPVDSMEVKLKGKGWVAPCFERGATPHGGNPAAPAP